MRVTEIEFGFTKNIGNYENQRLTYRAILEPWENPEESLAILRDRVAQELNLPDRWHDLKCKCAIQILAMEALELQLKAKKTELVKAEMAWDNFAEFLTAHGVDPTTLSVENFHNTRIEHSPCITNDCQPESKADESQGGYYEPPKLTDIEQMRILHDIAVADDDEDEDEDEDEDDSDYCYGEM